MRNKRVFILIQTLLLLLFVGYYGAITLFPHSHIINGEKITHSHPISSGKHNHSASQLQQLSSLSSLQTTQGKPCSIPDLILLTKEIKFSYIQKEWNTENKVVLSLRAPPAFNQYPIA